MDGLADFNASKALFNLVKLDIVMKRGKLNPFEMFDEAVPWYGNCRSC